MIVDGPTYDVFERAHRAEAERQAALAVESVRSAIAPARDLHDLARVADAVIDCGDPGQDPGDEDDGDGDSMRMLYRTNERARYQLGLSPDPWLDEPLTPAEASAIKDAAGRLVPW